MATDRIRVDIRCQMGYNFWQPKIEYHKRWGRVPKVEPSQGSLAVWTPKGQAGRMASRPANLSGQETPPGLVSGKLSVS